MLILPVVLFGPSSTGPVGELDARKLNSNYNCPLYLVNEKPFKDYNELKRGEKRLEKFYNAYQLRGKMADFGG